jgi:hypothetical protein
MYNAIPHNADSCDYHTISNACHYHSVIELIYNAAIITKAAPIAPMKDPARTDAALALTVEGEAPVVEAVGLGLLVAMPVALDDPPADDPLPDPLVLEDPLEDPVAVAMTEPDDAMEGAFPSAPLVGATPPPVTRELKAVDAETTVEDPEMDEVAEADEELELDEMSVQERSNNSLPSFPMIPKLGLGLEPAAPS